MWNVMLAESCCYKAVEILTMAICVQFRGVCFGMICRK